MRVFRLAAAVVAVPLFLAAAAQAQTADQPQVQGAATAVTESVEVAETAEQTATLDEVVCRAQGRAASRLQSRARVCKTRREWRVVDDEQAAAAARTQNRDRFNPPCPSANRPQ
ncbi:MAG: hypothetical protein ACI9YM_001045 [Brevundimonas sp.]|jgi:hypothetical protein|uniref:hypothetical protein n=1 Tax=Brevundimonas sp. TaxID=1871086 RepID=UPI002487EDFD|nr:hypothetical protein [Brevundimonas sp.]MDI1280114.1 hypothetical protein [Brevundimonas sp.]